MGLVRTEITLKNSADLTLSRKGHIKEENIRQITVVALVDSGAWTLVINEEVREKLGLDIIGLEPGTLADGKQEMYKLAGPLEVNWKNRRTSCDALVLPDAKHVLLGAIPLEGMDLAINPREEAVVGVHGEEIQHLV